MVKLSTCSIKSKSCSLKSFRKQYYTKKLQHTFCNKYLNVRMKKSQKAYPQFLLLPILSVISFSVIVHKTSLNNSFLLFFVTVPIIKQP